MKLALSAIVGMLIFVLFAILISPPLQQAVQNLESLLG